MKYGRVTAEEYGGKVLVFLDDIDVSSVCIAADDEEGWTLRLQTDENGCPEIPLEVYKTFGSVRIEPRE